jgi:hypothetical protein
VRLARTKRSARRARAARHISARLEPGPLSLRPRLGWTIGCVADAIAAPADKAERLASRSSGQSGRVGFVVAAKEAGAVDTAIAATTRHKSLAMIKRCGEATDQRRCTAPAEGCEALTTLRI